jgi:hypothetical protein
MIGLPPPDRSRFLASIAQRISPEQVEALFLFGPLRQGALETGVAVVAASQVPPVALGDAPVAGIADSPAEPDAPVAGIADSPADPPTRVRAGSLTVLTATYRHTIKGPDRGKWEFELLEHADAPLVTVESVVRGVQQRHDDGGEPERIAIDELRAALAEGVWTAPSR